MCSFHVVTFLKYETMPSEVSEAVAVDLVLLGDLRPAYVCTPMLEVKGRRVA